MAPHLMDSSELYEPGLPGTTLQMQSTVQGILENAEQQLVRAFNERECELLDELSNLQTENRRLRQLLEQSSSSFHVKLSPQVEVAQDATINTSNKNTCLRETSSKNHGARATSSTNSSLRENSRNSRLREISNKTGDLIDASSATANRTLETNNIAAISFPFVFQEDEFSPWQCCSHFSPLTDSDKKRYEEFEIRPVAATSSLAFSSPSNNFYPQNNFSWPDEDIHFSAGEADMGHRLQTHIESCMNLKSTDKFEITDYNCRSPCSAFDV